MDQTNNIYADITSLDSLNSNKTFPIQQVSILLIKKGAFSFLCEKIQRIGGSEFSFDQERSFLLSLREDSAIRRLEFIRVFCYFYQEVAFSTTFSTTTHSEIDYLRNFTAMGKRTHEDRELQCLERLLTKHYFGNPKRIIDLLKRVYQEAINLNVDESQLNAIFNAREENADERGWIKLFWNCISYVTQGLIMTALDMIVLDRWWWVIVKEALKFLAPYFDNLWISVQVVLGIMIECSLWVYQQGVTYQSLPMHVLHILWFFITPVGAKVSTFFDNVRDLLKKTEFPEVET